MMPVMSVSRTGVGRALFGKRGYEREREIEREGRGIIIPQTDR